MRSKLFILIFVLHFLHAEEVVENVVVIGGGMGSLTAALYLARAGLQPLVIEGGEPGGLLTQSHSVQNWPGVMEIAGGALTEKVRSQVEANGARIVKAEVVHVDFSKKPYRLTIRSLEPSKTMRQLQTTSCIIGMGTVPNFLHVKGEGAYWGRGVTNCAVCDGSLYLGKKVGVVGGGDAAILEALYLANIAKEVHLFVRKDALRGVESNRIKTLLQKKNVILHYHTKVVAVEGDGENLTGVQLQQKDKKPFLFPLDGLFLAIGSKPNSTLLKGQLELDSKGYIVLKKDQETSRPGIYAVGDIVDPIYKQAVTAAGDGAKAAIQVQTFLMDKPKRIAAIQDVKKEETHFEVAEIVSVQQLEEILQEEETPVILDFYATWCNPCKSVYPLIESSAQKLAGKVRFFKVDVDKVLELRTMYKIRSMPTLLLLDPSGKVVERKVGIDQIESLLQRLDE